MQTIECNRCNICDQPASLEQAKEVRRVNCHVRSHRDDIFTVWRCTNCASLHSREPVELEKYYSDYPLKKHKPSIHTAIGYRNRLALLKQIGLTKRSRILDYGCGAGLFVSYLRQQGYLQTNGYDTFIPQFADPEVLNLRYDMVVSFDVLEHVEDPGAFFSILFELTAPNGNLVIGTPNASGLDLRASTPPVELSQPFHRPILSEKALLQVATRLKLKKVRAFHRSYFDSPIPSINMRFMWAYLNRSGGMLDAMVEPIKWRLVFSSPKLIFCALFGYVFPEPGNMILAFQKPQLELVPDSNFEPSLHNLSMAK
jgi:2-polyprenyl-3-methyl-5-hydroxy-6-metoxy-1,4-benzoquinol methylase